MNLEKLQREKESLHERLYSSQSSYLKEVVELRTKNRELIEEKHEIPAPAQPEIDTAMFYEATLHLDPPDQELVRMIVMERLRLDLQKGKDDSKHMQELLAAKAREKALQEAKDLLEQALKELRDKYEKDMKERDKKCAELNAQNRDLV